jgi:hypothetical protein
MEGQVRTLKESQRARGTRSLPVEDRELVRTPKESQRARGTHDLLRTEGRTSSNTESERQSDESTA